jgi:hypothetical protein
LGRNYHKNCESWLGKKRVTTGAQIAVLIRVLRRGAKVDCTRPGPQGYGLFHPGPCQRICRRAAASLSDQKLSAFSFQLCSDQKRSAFSFELIADS